MYPEEALRKHVACIQAVTGGNRKNVSQDVFLRSTPKTFFMFPLCILEKHFTGNYGCIYRKHIACYFFMYPEATPCMFPKDTHIRNIQHVCQRNTNPRYTLHVSAGYTSHRYMSHVCTGNTQRSTHRLAHQRDEREMSVRSASHRAGHWASLDTLI